MVKNRTFKYTIYRVPSKSELGYEFKTVISDNGQRANAPCEGAERIESFYGQSTLTRSEMERTYGYIVQSKVDF